jgi:redox-sensitive bicupin YhaK (pirin superfamily)
MGGVRKIKKLMKAVPTMEGAGVHLKRVFGFYEAPELDPFLLLDDFHSDDPDKYLVGFPWHPHRGIETITYLIEGEVEHGDSMGNKGVIGEGDVQWMTAGSGIVHQEMPKGRSDGKLWGFQLWANLPASEKMMHPRYRDVTSGTIPEVSPTDGVTIKIISGDIEGTKGPVQDIVTDPGYLDITIDSGIEWKHRVEPGYTVLVYVIGGEGYFGPERDNMIRPETLVLYEDGDSLTIKTDTAGVRFLLISGKPIGEPVAWRGPIVMNTEEELRIAFAEYRDGTFLKHD